LTTPPPPISKPSGLMTNQTNAGCTTDLMCKQKQWDEARRTIYSTLSDEDGQYLCAGLLRDSVIITNLGVGEKIDDQLKAITSTPPHFFQPSRTKTPDNPP
jgi:hypothetical protein